MRSAVVLIGVSVLLHSFFAWHQSFTNDEGAYLYDARTLLRGELSSGDVLTKAPVPIFFFAIGEFFTRNSLFAVRIVNCLVSIATVVPLFFLLRALGGKKAAHIGAAVWLLGSGTIIFHTVGHTQVIASFFAVFSLCLFVLGVVSEKIQAKYIFFAGICFALAYASRKTAVTLVVPLVLSWIILRDSYKTWVKTIGLFFVGALCVCIVWLVAIYTLYGFPGVWHALGAGYGAILVQSQTIQPWAGSAEHMFTEAVRMGAVYGLLLLAACTRSMRDRVLIGTSWVGSLAILYFLWPTHLVEYLADFIPPIVIAGAVALGSIRFTRLQAYIIVGIFGFVNIASLYAVYKTPWTGMFTRGAILESATWLKEHVPYEDEIFTAAVIVPYVSGHSALFHLSHPQWYRYAFISEHDKNIFLPSQKNVQEAVEMHVSWVVRDQLTSYSYPNISLDAFREIVLIPNFTTFRTNPIRVYLRE